MSILGITSASAAQVAPATVTQPDAHTPLNSGGSSTPFTLVLPVNSHCSQDTATGRYHVYTYITSTDPATETFLAGTGPADGFPLYGTSTANGQAPLIDQSTAINSGNIAQEPTMDFSLFSTDGTGGTTNVLPPGTYNAGIACATPTGALDVYWNVQLTFVANASDPNGEVWSVVPNTTVPESALTIALPIGAVVVLGLGVFVVRRRRDNEPVASAA
jgi:hypothetical protein